MTSAWLHWNHHRRLYFFGLAVGAIVAAAGLLVKNAAAELKGPGQNDRQIAQTVVHKLKEEHVTRHPLDEEISKRFFKGFLKTLDPMKLYFTKDDFDAFSPQESD